MGAGLACRLQKPFSIALRAFRVGRPFALTACCRSSPFSAGLLHEKETAMAEAHFKLFSPAFAPNGPIPQHFTCDGKNISPEIGWMHPPEGTQSLALVVDDPDAPKGTFTHWVLFNIPAGTEKIPEGDSSVGVAGRNSFQATGYGGPCPPPNHGDHRYYFRMFALDVDSLDLEPGTTKHELEKAMEGHVLGEAELMGRYKRQTG
jgi:hypothetical protein